MLKSIYDQNIAKLKAKDTLIFKAIAEDIFITTRIEHTRGSHFARQVITGMRKVGLQPEPAYLRALLNLNEMINARPGVMVIGDAMAGKTQGLAVLQNVQNHLYREELKHMSEDFVRRRAMATNPEVETDEKADASSSTGLEALTP